MCLWLDSHSANLSGAFTVLSLHRIRWVCQEDLSELYGKAIMDWAGLLRGTPKEGEEQAKEYLACSEQGE